MKNKIILLVAILATPLFASAQGKSNDQIAHQIKSLGVEKQISVSFDQAGNTSKLKAVTDNFRQGDTDAAGARAINMAFGFFYAGNSLQTAPDRVLLSLWVLTKKPRFATDHRLVIDSGNGQIDLGEGRYSPKPQMDMEYLNYEISRQDLATVASGSNVVFRVGQNKFTVTPDQLKVIRAVTKIADTSTL